MYKLQKIGTYCDFDDNSIKCVFENKNGNVIEMTLLQNKKQRDVVCAPTHYYCSMGCKMCHLTNFFSTKSMLRIPYDEFEEALMRTVCIEDGDNLVRRTYKKEILISYMGVGEPLMNIDLIRDTFTNDVCVKQLGYTSSSYALATMFPSFKLFDKLFETVKEYNIPLKVHYSMHYPDDENRTKLIPNTEPNLEEILKRLDGYFMYFNSPANPTEETKRMLCNYHHYHRGGSVEIHYTLIDNVNDSIEYLGKVLDILKTHYYGIKFIDFNEVGNMKKSIMLPVWQDILSKDASIAYKTKYYTPPGRNIGSSCGQFTKHYFVDTETDEEKIEFENWKNKYGVNETIIKNYGKNT